MKKRRVGIRHRSSRVVLSEILPYEVPVTFSNIGFYRFLNDSKMQFTETAVTFRSDQKDLLPVLRIIFGANSEITATAVGTGYLYSLARNTLKKPTIPLLYNIRHLENRPRQLSIVHPKSQIALVDFYATYSTLLLYHTGRGAFSVRHPHRVARYTIVRDSVFSERRARRHGTIETTNAESDRIRSYFVYRKYDNIHKFYESQEYGSNEKRFGHLMRLDISQCFDSVYTHSITWATSDKEAVKRALYGEKLPGRIPSFGDQFDVVMMRLNDNETHGIPIGPEFSRIFAEIILQRVDTNVERVLRTHGIEHGRDYDILRYVDDYFVFMRDPTLRDPIVNVLADQLVPFRFHLNTSKEVMHSTPFISDMSIAKSRLVQVLEHELRIVSASDSPELAGVSLEFTSSSRRMIASYKTVLRESGLGPLDIGNFALATAEVRLESLMEKYMTAERRVLARADDSARSRLLLGNQKAAARVLIAAVELAFYVFGGCPRVGPSIKLARIVTLCREFASEMHLVADVRASLDDLIFNEVLIQLNRNPLSKYASVESLYLLTLLSELGEHYRIGIEDLCRFVGVSVESRRGYTVPDWYNALIVAELFRFMADDLRFVDLRAALEQFMLARVETMVKSRRSFAEEPIYVLNAIASPYVSLPVKAELLRFYGVTDPHDADLAIEVQDSWFTNWRAVDLLADLQLKRVQEVY